LIASILDGKGKEMPSFRSKLTKDQARDLAAYVRAFAPTTGKSEREQQQEATSRSALDKEFRHLQEERDQLKKQLHEVSRESASSKGPEPTASSPPTPAAKPAVEPAARGQANRNLFRQHCVKCHGTDGTGSRMRRRLPGIPNFAEAAWQARQSDADLLDSILDGKGEKMPSFRAKLNEDQARSLVAYLRAFAAATGTAEHALRATSSDPDSRSNEEPEEPAPDPSEEAELPGGFFGKLILWLGRFHPPAVHFPIALLTAAAVAELLRLATGKPVFDAVSRYCVWFGTVAAFGGAGLGWFLGGFHLTDDAWELTTHRWLGTSTVVCASLVLVLSEVSYHPDRRRTRICFRVTLLLVAALVLVTGFFGGAVIFGLDHYTWPQ
jgi:mono/diheme cytochrome c family protein/uncharacterized membrane protein